MEEVVSGPAECPVMERLISCAGDERSVSAVDFPNMLVSYSALTGGVDCLGNVVDAIETAAKMTEHFADRRCSTSAEKARCPEINVYARFRRCDKANGMQWLIAPGAQIDHAARSGPTLSRNVGRDDRLGAGAIGMVGTNIGAGNVLRAERIAWIAAALAAGVTGCIGLFGITLPDVWINLFTDVPEVHILATSYLVIASLAYPFLGLGLILASAFQAAGRPLWPVLAISGRAV